jgi:hypothetical protein
MIFSRNKTYKKKKSRPDERKHIDRFPAPLQQLSTKMNLVNLYLIKKSKVGEMECAACTSPELPKLDLDTRYSEITLSVII